MKRILALLFSVVFLLTACGENENSLQNLSKDEVYFFYQETCPHCHNAAKYITEKHPNMKIKGLDVKMPGNMKLLQQAAKDYKLPTKSIGTPLICFGKNYIMGWSDEDMARLDTLALHYENKE